MLTDVRAPSDCFTQTYPVIGVMVVASALAVGYIGRLAVHPYSRWTPLSRSSELNDDALYGDKYYNHYVRRSVTGGEPRIMAGFQNWMSGANKRKYQDDENDD